MIKLAECGDANSQFLLGTRYRDGYGVTKNNKHAVEWLRKSAIHGLERAQYSLANILLKEEGDSAYDEAVVLLVESAKQGNNDAKKRLKEIVPLLILKDINYE